MSGIWLVLIGLCSCLDEHWQTNCIKHSFRCCLNEHIENPEVLSTNRAMFVHGQTWVGQLHNHNFQRCLNEHSTTPEVKLVLIGLCSCLGEHGQANRMSVVADAAWTNKMIGNQVINCIAYHCPLSLWTWINNALQLAQVSSEFTIPVAHCHVTHFQYARESRPKS